MKDVKNCNVPLKRTEILNPRLQAEHWRAKPKSQRIMRQGTRPSHSGKAYYGWLL
jgi:hypothetical protein